jgi:hypothetical protein
MTTLWIVVGGKPVQVEAEVEGEYAAIPLPLGGFRRVRWPNWYQGEGEAAASILRKREARLERARRLIDNAGRGA